MKQTDITVGTRIAGILPSEAVEIIQVKPHGVVTEIFYQTNRGDMGKRMLYEEDLAHLHLLDRQLPWQFDGDADRFKLASEAYRIELAHLFDPLLAVHTSSIAPLPHQISAVYEKMLPQHPLRYILADDPGAGKTIMTGLLIKELMIRGDVQRCMVVCPGNLAEQWQEELFQKFGLQFEILTNDRIESAITGNIFMEMPFCIARLDKLARDEALQEKLKASEWDLIVCDEAHKMSATVNGRDVKYTKRFRLGQLLGTLTRHFLLLTATPHNGKEADFRLFLSLVDPDRFEGAQRSVDKMDVSDIMRRLVKEELVKFDGKPLFPERISYTVQYELSPREKELYEAVTNYVKNEFNRADKLSKKAKNTVGFALTILQRRLASSPEAIYQSLRRRYKRLEELVQDMRRQKEHALLAYDWDAMLEDQEDAPDAEWQQQEEKIESEATASRTIQEMEAEIATLKELTAMANAVRMSGEDRKWDELSRLLQENEQLKGVNGGHEKLIIFTEHKDTLHYLQQKISSLLGNANAVVTIHGGMRREERHQVEAAFRQDKEVRVLLATDAAGEGINLQTAHLMVNFDLPWNPNRLEQRFGRIHRIGQTEVCYLWNLVAKDTREGDVFTRLFKKLEEERKALGGKVFDILGKVSFDDKPLRDLLIEAIRYGQDPQTKAYLDSVLDTSLDRHHLEQVIAEQSLTKDILGRPEVASIRAEMERIEARKLQPYFIESFFLAAFKKLGGTCHRREEGRYELTYVPLAMRHQERTIGFGKPVLKSYERITFQKERADIPGLLHAEFICPGHPLLESVVSLVRQEYGAVLKQGTVLVDPAANGDEVRLLFYLEDCVQDGCLLSNGRHRLVSKHVHYVELRSDGQASEADYAPYLDYRPVKEKEQVAATNIITQESWLQADTEELAKDYAIEQILPEHLREVRQHQTKLLDHMEQAVKTRLRSEIQYWDLRASELQEQEAKGKHNDRLNAQQAERRADQLNQRLTARLARIQQAKDISLLPPVIIGAALVIPEQRLSGAQGTFTADAAARREIERAGMQAVLAIEQRLGYKPKDVSKNNVGYDIESAIPASKLETEGSLRFIEVKDKAKGSTTVTVTRNEILTALNQPERFILALVEVDGAATHTWYIRQPFRNQPDSAAASINFAIQELLQSGTCMDMGVQAH